MASWDPWDPDSVQTHTSVVRCHSDPDNGGLADTWGVTESRIAHAQNEEHLRDLGHDDPVCEKLGDYRPHIGHNEPQLSPRLVSYDDLWRPTLVSDYPESNSSIIDPTDSGLRVRQDGCCVCPTNCMHSNYWALVFALSNHYHLLITSLMMSRIRSEWPSSWVFTFTKRYSISRNIITMNIILGAARLDIFIAFLEHN